MIRVCSKIYARSDRSRPAPNGTCAVQVLYCQIKFIQWESHHRLFQNPSILSSRALNCDLTKMAFDVSTNPGSGAG
ncbi:unnamed protein product [Periconia digitata]|uniref:Uncharacterized protein n=1 Tax=Periconia digitata TaxID=1303443 RepID=A0A9W4XGI2_9PLEO|nr:unnamed protein product [Periconia digitata]